MSNRKDEYNKWAAGNPEKLYKYSRREIGIAMSFLLLNPDHKQFRDTEKCLPYIRGLRSKRTRRSFVYDLVNNLHKAGLKLSEK